MEPRIERRQFERLSRRELLKLSPVLLAGALAIPSLRKRLLRSGIAFSDWASGELFQREHPAATFPDLESLPNVSDQAILYFSATMGTLTEVDLVTSGSFHSEFSAENLGPSSSTIAGTTRGNLSINVPTGAIPVTIPSVTQTFDASAFDGTLDSGGTSGKAFAPVTSTTLFFMNAPSQLLCCCHSEWLQP